MTLGVWRRIKNVRYIGIICFPLHFLSNQPELNCDIENKQIFVI